MLNGFRAQALGHMDLFPSFFESTCNFVFEQTPCKLCTDFLIKEKQRAHPFVRSLTLFLNSAATTWWGREEEGSRRLGIYTHRDQLTMPKAG